MLRRFSKLLPQGEEHAIRRRSIEHACRVGMWARNVAVGSKLYFSTRGSRDFLASSRELGERSMGTVHASASAGVAQ